MLVHINASVQWAFALIYIKVTCCHPVLLFRTACFVCIWYTFTFYVLSLALSLGVVILCRPQLRDSRSPRVWKSLIPACIRPSSHRSPSPFAVLMSLCARLPLCTSKWKQVKSRLTVSGRAKPSKARAVQHRGCPDAGGSTQSVREQSFPGCFLEECPPGERVDTPEWNCFKRWAKRLEAQIKIDRLVQFSEGGKQTKQSKPWKRKILKKGAKNLSCVKANNATTQNFWNGCKWMTIIELRMRIVDNQQKAL